MDTTGHDQTPTSATTATSEQNALAMCAPCSYLEECMERWELDTTFKAQQERCRLAKMPEVCCKCGVKKEDSQPINGMSWAWRHQKNYCPKCYQSLSPLLERDAPQQQSADDKKDKDNRLRRKK